MNGAEKTKREGAVRLWAGAEGRETHFAVVNPVISKYKDRFHHKI